MIFPSLSFRFALASSSVRFDLLLLWFLFDDDDCFLCSRGFAVICERDRLVGEEREGREEKKNRWFDATFSPPFQSGEALILATVLE